MKQFIWSLWIIVTLSIAGYLGYTMFAGEDKSEFLIGEATYGHYQIEMACTTCHAEAFGGEEILQDACISCHADELEAAHDSHPKKKFNDPRNADRLEVLDARYCISCHTEHQADQTHEMGVTIAGDYCYHCHQEISEERESHKDLAFDSCASSGCHNYHDNRALYERFLVENADGVWLKAIAEVAEADGAQITSHHAMSLLEKQFLVTGSQTTEAPKQHWDDNLHFQSGVGCIACHGSDSSNNSDWVSKPAPQTCKQCHSHEVDGYLKGKHGMRLAQSLSAVMPSQSSLQFHPQVANSQHSCISCHKSGEFNTRFAATQACLSCHADEHSQAFINSPHGQLAHQVRQGEIPATQGVTCATCHMPKTEKNFNGKKLLMVEHNQNDNLRPNEKMIRPVCMSCHSLAFSIDALADQQLIKNNFNGKPSKHVPSIDWATARER